MKTIKKIAKFCLPIAIYIVCSLLALLIWQLLKFDFTPIAVSSIALLIIGSFSAGFFSKDRIGKNGMFFTIAAILLSNILMIIAYIANNITFAYVATSVSSYLFNIQTCIPLSTPDYAIYIEFAISIIAPIAFIFLGKFIRNKNNKKK